ncbi:MFS transporter [Paractinoplanes deccanensis]|uniref:MFS transporter n=1 Tax=Paractinoplanes deccanensis TaxID=113561 RepID=A0ABQ3Y6D9_9ACTN|nr:MFS transporter [Actinoplanes deccanensis]GID75554.1 MFS transporter [Actinoplanes deccanensis]
MRALSEGVPLYPVYALLFADAGLTTAQVSSLFVIWSVVAFAAEVPSGALADVWSRKRSYAAGELLTAAGYALWLLWPSYPGFALGFVLWGLGGSLGSGALEALVYDALSDERAYTRLIGRAETVSILAMLAATLLATPALHAGGYLLVGALSIAVKLIGALLALHLPETRSAPAPPHTPAPPPTAPQPPPPAGPTPDRHPALLPLHPHHEPDISEISYWHTLRDGVREAVGTRVVARALLVAALVPGFSALDEYLPLLTRDKGAPTDVVPLLFAVTALAMAAGSALAERGRGLGWALCAAATLLAAGALAPHLAGMVAVSAAFGLLQYAMIRAEARLQATITGRARTTVLSVAGFASEVFAVLLYLGFAVDLPLAVLFALAGVPLVLTALLAA